MKAFWCYLGVLGVAAGAFFFVPANTWQHDLLQVALGWTAAAAVVVSVRRRRLTANQISSRDLSEAALTPFEIV